MTFCRDRRDRGHHAPRHGDVTNRFTNPLTDTFANPLTHASAPQW